MPDARILIVEDEGIQALDMQHRLVALGYPLPDIANSGEEAISKAQEVKPDLVLMDVMLPGEIDGVTAAERLRADFDIPVIYITAYADEETLNRARITEPYGYIVKPFKERELHITIDIALYKHKMEKKVKESEKWLATTLKSIGDAVIAVDRDGLVTFMNTVAEGLMGWKLEEALGRKLTGIFNIVNRDTRLPTENPVAKVLQSGFIVGLANHTVLIARNGKEIPIDDSAAPIKDDRGNITGVILVFRDITERDRAEEAMLRAKEEWERTFKTIPDLIAILDKDHRVLRVNQAMADRLGLQPEKCIGVKCHEAVHGLSQPPAFCPHALTCRDGMEHVTEVHEPILGGDFLVSTTPLCDEKQQLIGSIHVARNITERKRMEDAVRKNEELLKRAQEIAHLGSWELDLQENRLSWSDEVYRIFGLQPQEFGATYQAFLEHVHPDDRASVDNAYSGSLQDNHDTYEIEHRVVRQDTGEIRFVHEKCGHFRDAAGRIVRSVGMVQDITSRKQAEEALAKQAAQLQERTAQLEEINKELESFSYSVSHDLRAPLRAIDGYARMILKRHGDKFDEDVQTRFNVIRENTQKMGQLIDDLLNLSRLGKQQMNPVKISMGDLANDIWKELQEINPERVMKLEIKDMPGAHGDKTLLRQAYLNLLGNAVKFTKQCPAAQIEAGGHVEGKENIYYIRDNGAGFDMAYYDRLFGVFQRLHSADDFEGTGVGLAIVQRIIHRHGGRVWAEGEVDKGATFYFTLPRA